MDLPNPCKTLAWAVRDAIACPPAHIDDDYRPLNWPRITEPQHDASDGTSRKLYKFLTNCDMTASCPQQLPTVIADEP